SSFSTHVISLRLLSLSSACSVPPPYLHSFPTRRSSDLAMFRMFTLLFYHEPSITHTLIGIMAGITLIGGSIGAIARTDVRQIVSYNVVIAVGFILIGLAVSTTTAMEGSIYYLIHDMIVKAMLYLLAGTMIHLTGTAKYDEMSGLIRNYPSLGWLFFLAMFSLTG